MFLYKLKMSSVAIYLVLFCTYVYPNPPDDSQVSCLLEPNNKIKVSSQVTGIVKEVNIKRGDRVSGGQVLLTLEDDSVRNTLEIAKVRYKYAKLNLERNVELISEGFISDAQHQELITNEKLAWLSVKEANILLQKQSIHSPIRGVVVKKHISVGEYVSVDPLVEVVNIDPLYAEVVFRANRYHTFKLGKEVTLQLEGKQAPYKGVVTVIDPVIDAASGTFGIRVEVPNPDEKITPGLNCRVLLHKSITTVKP